MSGLEDRCVMFHEAAMGTGKTKGAAKEIATLRKFLHKNQTQRFTDKATSRLFDTIQIYATGGKGESAPAVSLEDREGLLEDALKMPFTVFSTKQKKTMLKWIEEIRGVSGGSSKTESSSKLTTLTVIDLENNQLSLMHEDSGETYEEVLLPSGDLGTQIAKAFETTEESVDVEAAIVDGIVSVVGICN
jgi:Eukaryotic elongation factor 5A hypusine, DNA-binding OB fold